MTEWVFGGAGGTYTLILAVDGFAPANFAGLSVRAQGGNFVGLLTTITVSEGGNFNSSFNLGNVTLFSAEKISLQLNITGLGAGQSISLPNSATLVFNRGVRQICG